MSELNAGREKVFNAISPIVVALSVAIIGVELVLQLAERGIIGGQNGGTWRIYLLRHFAFHDAVFEHILQNRRLEWATLWPFLTYPFLHLGIGHAAIGAAIFIAMGKTISENFSGLSVIVLFVACTLVGAFVYGFTTDNRFPLVGAYPAIYGFISAFTWIEYMRLKRIGENPLFAFRIIIMILVIRVVFAVSIGLRESWTADLSGLVAGFLLSFILAPDGRARIKSWINAARNR